MGILGRAAGWVLQDSLIVDSATIATRLAWDLRLVLLDAAQKKLGYKTHHQQD
jgi:hypothetical protein